MKRCAICGVTEHTSSIHTHHVLGRVGKNCNNPSNLILLCFSSHRKWHDSYPEEMADKIYLIMKSIHGDNFPIEVNGHKYYPKWLLKAEERMNGEKDVKPI